jgi:acetyl esterase/lipase
MSSNPASAQRSLAATGRARGILRRVPVWVWRWLMAGLGPGELIRFNAEPITTVDYATDLDYAGDGIQEHRLDVLTPHGAAEPLPVYVYFHGGGWTSGDKAVLTKYCASQAASGMVVVNANYRRAVASGMQQMIEDADSVLGWVREHIADYGGDPEAIVLGGDSAGGQIAALYTAVVTRQELANYYGVTASVPPSSLRGLVQHCSAADFSVLFERGFILGLGFVRMLLPHRARAAASTRVGLRRAARFLSPIEWVHPAHPPTFVTTSERDYFYRASLNFVDRLRAAGVEVDTLVYEGSRRNTEHTWQQNSSFPESQEVYRRLQDFVRSVTKHAQLAVSRTE